MDNRRTLVENLWKNYSPGIDFYNLILTEDEAMEYAKAFDFGLEDMLYPVRNMSVLSTANVGELGCWADTIAEAIAVSLNIPKLADYQFGAKARLRHYCRAIVVKLDEEST